MPFFDLSLKLVIVVASLLAHHALVGRCASVGVAPNATIHASAPALSNPSAPESSRGRESVPSDLLDESKLTFLAECKTNDPVTEEICKLYRSLSMVLSQRDRDPVTATDVNKIIAEQTDADRFCDSLSPLVLDMTKRYPDRFEKNRLETNRFCERWCVPYDDKTMTSMHVKPICKVLLWGFQKELLSEVEEHDPAKQVAKAMVPPMLPIAVAGEPVVENSHAETNPVHPAVAAQPNITLPETNVESSPQKNIEPDRSKVSSDKAAGAAAAVPPAAIGDTSVSHPTAVSTSTKPVVTPGNQNPIEEDDSQELRNQENLKDMNGNSPSVNVQEDIDPDDYDSGTDNELPEASENLQPKLDNEPFGVKGPDSGDPAGDQKADSAVQVERVEQVDPFFDQDDSNFFSYFLFMMFVCILCYVAYHNKSKLLALVLEGRRNNSGRGGFNKGRKHTAAYRKLDSNLEEAITSNTAASSRSTSQIIY